jgi:hypothetical protein
MKHFPIAIVFTVGFALDFAPTAAAAATDAFQVRGFAEFELTYFDYPENFYRDRYTGPQRDRRIAADISRLSVEGMRPLGEGLVTEFELTIRHQGISGQSEPNFGGSFSDEHHGAATEGAVELSKLLLAKHFGESLSIYGGRIPVTFGQLALVDSPMDYLGTRPFEAEVRFLPEEWSELGIAASIEVGRLTSTTEIVNGLDSTGFNSFTFVADGHQGRYGFVKATEPAVVQRLDFAFDDGGSSKVGSSVYYGETSQNRPTPDLARACGHHEQVSACGYVHAPLTMVDAHMSHVSSRLRGSGLLLWGQLRDAASVNVANEKGRTNLPDFFTPVGEKAFAAAAELGVNVAADPTHRRVEPFIRFDRLNTMWHTAQTKDKTPVSDRSVLTAGISARLDDSFYVKSDYSRRHFANPDLSYESSYTVSSGFRF